MVTRTPVLTRPERVTGRARVDFSAQSSVGACPECGESDAILPILYRFPSAGAMGAVERDEIVLAGCMVSDADASFYCRRSLIAFEFARQLARPDAATPVAGICSLHDVTFYPES